MKLSEAERHILKEELKAEMLSEMTAVRTSRPSAYCAVRKEIQRVACRKYPKRNESYKVEMTICSILRYKFGLSTILNMSDEQAVLSLRLLPGIYSMLGMEEEGAWVE